jgi:hypothetical protein
MRRLCYIYNRFWIGFIGTSLQIQPIITAHTQWLPKTRSIPYWTTSVFSSTVTWFWFMNQSLIQLPLSAVPQLNTWLLLLLNHWTPLWMHLAHGSRFTVHSLTELPGEPNREHYVFQFLYYCVILLPGKHVLVCRWLAMNFRVCSLLRKCMFGKPLASNGLLLWLHYSDFKVSCHKASGMSGSLLGRYQHMIAPLDLRLSR